MGSFGFSSSDRKVERLRLQLVDSEKYNFWQNSIRVGAGQPVTQEPVDCGRHLAIPTHPLTRPTQLDDFTPPHSAVVEQTKYPFMVEGR